MDTIKFGPAGNSLSFYDEGHKNTWEAMEWVAAKGLNAFEYSCGKGINIGEEAAARIGEEAVKNGISISVHAPYYTNLANEYSDKRAATNKYVIDSLLLCRQLRGSRVVFHPGAYMKREKEPVNALAREQMKQLMLDIDNAGCGDMTVCPETMGKLGQLGDIDEILGLASVDERIIPCFDFGHIYARSLGAVNSTEQFDGILKTISNKIGSERMRKLHIHFSHIEFTQSGEKQHHTFADTQWGPDFRFLAEALYKNGAQPVIICESKGTMAEDAVEMKRIFSEINK